MYEMKLPVMLLLNRLSIVISCLGFLGIYPIIFELSGGQCLVNFEFYCIKDLYKFTIDSTTFWKIFMVKLQFLCFNTIIDNVQSSVTPYIMGLSITVIFKCLKKLTFYHTFKNKVCHIIAVISFRFYPTHLRITDFIMLKKRIKVLQIFTAFHMYVQPLIRLWICRIFLNK